jgi:hypothetical protein
MSGSPGVFAVDRTRGRVWGKLQKGATQESNGPAFTFGSRAQARAPAWASRERILGGSKAPKRAIRPHAGEPDVSGRSSGAHHGATRVLTLAVSAFAGNPVPVHPVAPWALTGPPHGSVGGARWKAIATIPSRRAGLTVEVEPAREQKAAVRRYGSSRGEGSEGRIPRALRHETRPQSSGASAVEEGSGKPGLFEATRLNPPRG